MSGIDSKRHIDTRQPAHIWLFDLDNTLYRSGPGLMKEISARIDHFIQMNQNLPLELAEMVRETYFGLYGSSVEGLLQHCKVEVEPMLEYIHDLPLQEYISADPSLNILLSTLPGDKYLFTNSPEKYAAQVLKLLGIEDNFSGIFGIEFGDYYSKPSPFFYQKVLEVLGNPKENCWFVEDSAKNLLPAKSLGCGTIWLSDQANPSPDFVDHSIQRLDQLITISELSNQGDSL